MGWGAQPQGGQGQGSGEGTRLQGGQGQGQERGHACEPTPARVPAPATPARPQVLVKVLEMCCGVFEALAGAGYQLTDYEAQLLLPAVVEKSGHNQVGGPEERRVRCP